MSVGRQPRKFFERREGEGASRWMAGGSAWIASETMLFGIAPIAVEWS